MSDTVPDGRPERSGAPAEAASDAGEGADGEFRLEPAARIDPRRARVDRAGFRRVLVVGVGLVGGSWALALRRAGFRGPVIGFDREEAVDAIAALGVVDEMRAGLPTADDVLDEDLVVVALPVRATESFLRERAPRFPAGAVVTDVASTKRAVCATAAAALSDATQRPARRGPAFVGGHPMAGSERCGAANARADLFDGASYFLVADEPADGDARARLWALVEGLGALPVDVSAEEHDRLVARASHLPQLLASALAGVLARGESVAPAAGPGLADMTRLAASPFTVWGDILATNADAILPALDETIAALAATREALRDGDERALAGLFASANAFGASSTPISGRRKRTGA